MNGYLLALVRAIQFMALISVPIGLYIGYKNRDMNFELSTLAIGAVVFYVSNIILTDAKKK